MKKVLGLGLGLFTLFAGSLSAVKVLDGYSRAYVDCAQSLAAQAETLTTGTLETRNFLLSLENDDIWLGDTACPRMLWVHKNKIRSLISA